MPASEIVPITARSTVQRWRAFDAAGATADGEWVEVSGVGKFSVHTTITNTATIQIRGSNATSAPANNTDGVQIGSDVSASAITAVTVNVRWMKIKISAWTSGTVTCDIEGIHGAG